MNYLGDKISEYRELTSGLLGRLFKIWQDSKNRGRYKKKDWLLWIN
jgi:hypothetical protein